MFTRKLLPLFSSAVVLFSASSSAVAEKYAVDPAHSSLSFSVEHLGLSHIDGRFTDFEGAIEWDPQVPNKTRVSFTAQATSVNTDVAKRDEHLRTADFFDVAKYPTLSFKSSKVTSLGEDRYQVDGDLTIHGVTRPVSTTAYILGPKDAMGSKRIGYRTTFKINRLDYKVGDGEKFSGNTMIGHDIFIEVKGEALGATPAQ